MNPIEEKKLIEDFKKMSLSQKIKSAKINSYYYNIMSNWYNSHISISLSKSIELAEIEVNRKLRLEKIKLLKNDKREEN